MTSPQPISENLTLFESIRLLLQELKGTNALLLKLLEAQANQSRQLTELHYLLNGFSSGGASLSAYITDPMTQAYLALMGPALASRLADQGLELPELMKGATLLARQLLEELSAYRSERGSLDYLDEQAELINDPWRAAEPQ